MKMKRLIATALAAAMIFGLVSVGLAASFPDVEEYDFADEVLRLADLGIIDGYGDGTFKPENLVKRSEFAKMIVCMLGLKNAAGLMHGEPVPFSDVDADHWAAGYINVAEMKGIVGGYPDGTFKPDGNITYAEALKMVLAAMGYVEDGFLVTRWPVTWIIQAAELELDKGLEVLANLPISRGEVAKLFDNSLTMKHVYVKEGEFTKRDPEVTFMSKLNVTYTEGKVTDSPELWTNTSGKVKIKGKDDERTFAIDDYEGLFGHNVRVWHKGSTALVVEDLSTEKLVTKKDYGNIKFADSALFVKNYVEVEEKPTVDTVYEIAVVYDGSTPIAAKVIDYTVGRIDSIYDYRNAIYVVGGGRLDLQGFDVEYKGEVERFGDLEAGDTIHYIRDAKNERAVIMVLRDTFKGRLTEVSSGGSKMKVGGEVFEAANGEVENAAKANVGALVTLYLDKNGKVFALKVDKEFEETTVAYGVVVSASQRLVDGKRTSFISVLTLDGEVEYESNLAVNKVVYIEEGVKEGTEHLTISELTNPNVIAEIKTVSTSAKTIEGYKYTDNTLWLEKTSSGSWVVRPRPYKGDAVDLYLVTVTPEDGESYPVIAVGVVKDVKETEEEPPVDPKGILFKGLYSLDQNWYIELGDDAYPYLGAKENDGTIKIGETTLEEGTTKVVPTFTTIRGETVVTKVELPE